MNSIDPIFIVPLGLVVLFVGVVAMIPVVRIVRSRRRARRRIVEGPNSQYTSMLARESQTRHRWHAMPLDRIHEINREEVVRLLAKVEATGVDALRANERTFLDHMAEVTGTRPPPVPREQGTSTAPTLRHRPA